LKGKKGKKDKNEPSCFCVSESYDSRPYQSYSNPKQINIVSMAECECGHGLKMEEHIFWDCKWYKDQRETMIAILSENSKKEYPESVTELLKKDLCKASVTS
jgi:hypothetical protein